MNGTTSLVRLQNASSTEVDRVPSLSFSKFRETVLYGVANDMRVAALFGRERRIWPTCAPIRRLGR